LGNSAGHNIGSREAIFASFQSVNCEIPLCNII
jgi:hypothetical protein